MPSDNVYYLTSFCDSSVACGKILFNWFCITTFDIRIILLIWGSFSGNCNDYYSADYSRFGCNSIISCCKGSDCVNLKVIDGGPSCSVENSAGKPVVDASYSTCKHFTGSTSCGTWSLIFNLFLRGMSKLSWLNCLLLVSWLSYFCRLEWPLLCYL